jgi:prenyltransferase beta subunit
MIFRKIQPHSIELFDVLLRANKLLSCDARGRISDFIFGQFTAEGGFCNRAGVCDQYYTMFGLGCAAALQLPLPLERIRYYLRHYELEDLDLVHLVCWAKSLLIIKLLRGPAFYPLLRLNYGLGLRPKLKTAPERFRTDSGGFADDGQSHPYAIFMGINLYQDSAVKLPDKPGAVAALESCRSSEGAFHNPHGGGQGMLLSTSAALLALRQLTGKVDAQAVEWMSKQQGETGGFHASPNTPMPDLLSTAVALFSLRICEYPLAAMADSAREFILDHWHENGGFTGTLVDDCADCEYTFYALMALGALAE